MTNNEDKGDAVSDERIVRFLRAVFRMSQDFGMPVDRFKVCYVVARQLHIDIERVERVLDGLDLGDETVTDFTAGNAPKVQTLTNILISVKAVWLSGHDPWDFEFMGEEFSARIYDYEFLERVENRELAFGHGDLLRVNALLTMSKVGTRTWSIVKVWEHISPNEPDSF